MKPFELTKKMLTMSGVFYPTGYAFIMFPDAESASQAAEKIDHLSDTVTLLTPDVVLKEIGKVDGDSAAALPDVGTEGATVQRYVNLARKGHHALMAAVPDAKAAELVTAEARKHNFSFGQLYHMLAIEDLE
jgi:hypothetical protein